MKAMIEYNDFSQAVDVTTIDQAIEMAISSMKNEGDYAEIYSLEGTRTFTIQRKEGEHHWNHPNFAFNQYIH